MNAEERKKLMKQVMDMHVLGSSYDDIAEKLGIARKSVANYLKHLRTKVYEDIKNTAEQEIAQMEINKQKRIIKLWNIVLDKNNKNVRDKARALDLLRKEEEFAVKKRQIIGIIPADKQEIEHTGVPLQEGITINIIQPNDDKKENFYKQPPSIKEENEENRNMEGDT